MRNEELEILGEYIPPTINVHLVAIEDGIAAASIVQPTSPSGQIFENTVNEDINESFDW